MHNAQRVSQFKAEICWQATDSNELSYIKRGETQIIFFKSQEDKEGGSNKTEAESFKTLPCAGKYLGRNANPNANFNADPKCYCANLITSRSQKELIITKL